MCTAEIQADPGHDAAACHAQMTGGIGVIVVDAGYCSDANRHRRGSVNRLIATGNRADHGQGRRGQSRVRAGADDATAIEKMDTGCALRRPRRLKRRAPDIEGVTRQPWGTGSSPQAGSSPLSEDRDAGRVAQGHARPAWHHRPHEPRR